VSSPNEVTLAANAGPFVVTLTVGPTGNGPTVLSATVTELSGGAAPAATVRLRLTAPGGATQEVALTPRNGRHIGLADLERAGRWTIEADVTPAGAATAAGTARFDLALPTGGARPLLADADAAMNRLTSVRERETIDSGQGVVTTEYEYAAPDRLRLRVGRGGETVAVGRRRFDRVAGGQWVAGAWLEEGGYRWPRFNWAATATEVTLLRREEVDGEPSWVVAFFSPEEDARYTLWIGERDALVRRVRMVFTGHAMETRFYDFNAPIVIEAPEGVR
jgi:copper transport protein